MVDSSSENEKIALFSWNFNETSKPRLQRKKQAFKAVNRRLSQKFCGGFLHNISKKDEPDNESAGSLYVMVRIGNVFIDTINK